jgi:anti-sigma-K factor RskA
MTMSPAQHDELREHASLYVLGTLMAHEREAFERHLSECAECAAEVQSLRPVIVGLAQAVPQHEPSQELRARVLASIGAAAFQRAQAATWRDRRANVVFPWLASAASFVLALGLGAYAVSLRARVSALETELRDAVARAASSESQIADLRRTSTEAQSQVAVLAAPDLQRIDLTGQPAAPQASGRAYWSRSRGLVFTALNLPAVTTGRTYQLWVLAGPAAPISAGVFEPDPQGRVVARFDTPLDLPTPTGMAVTIEPAGGGPAPTGAMYLVGL